MDTFRKNIIPRVSVAVWVLLALGLSLGASQEQWYQTTVDNQVTDICWSDMVMDRQGVPVIAFLRNGACPGPYVANWETDHWAVEALLPECLDSFDCARPVSVPIDLAVDSQNNPHVVFGTNRPGAQYFRRENQQWVGNTISLSAYPVALAIDTDDTPTVVLLSSLFDEGVGQDHWIARKTAETWTIEGVGTFEEAGSHQLRIGPAGDIFIGFQKGRSLTLLKKNGAVFQEIFSVTGDSSNNLAFDVDNSNKVHLALLKPQIGFDPRLWAYGTSPSFSLTTFPRSNVNGVIDLALSTDGHPRVAFTDFFVDVYAEWNGVGFSTETLKFSFLGNTFQLRRKLNLTLSRENHPYRLAPTLVGTTLTLGLSAKLPVPPRLEQTDQSPSSIQWSWSGAPSPAVSGYRVRRADDNADVSGILTPTTTSWTLTGTNANEAVSAALETIYPGFVLVSSSVTSFSAAVAPRDVGLSRSGEGPLSVNWSANGNSPETSYRLDFRGADGSALSETVQSASTVYPFLNPRVPYGLTVTTLGRDGTERSLSTVESVIATAQETRLSFSLDGLIVEARLFPVEGRPSPVVAASPVERYPALTDALWAGSDRGFQLVMDRPLPDDQGATVSVQFPSGWLDTLPAGVKVLARYDSAHARWVPLPTREGSRQLIAQVDGWGVFQVLVKTPTSGGTPPRTAYPNPFRPTDGRTMIWRDVSPGGQVKVNALDGRLVCTLLGNETGLVEWDGRDADGAAVKSGVYLLSFEDQGATTNVKVIVER